MGAFLNRLPLAHKAKCPQVDTQVHILVTSLSVRVPRCIRPALKACSPTRGGPRPCRQVLGLCPKAPACHSTTKPQVHHHASSMPSPISHPKARTSPRSSALQ